MRLLVTGSAGLVGRGLCRALVARGDDVVLFDLVDGLDVRNADQVVPRAEGVDGVVHLAAVSRVAWGEQDPATTIATNVGGMQHVVQAVRAIAPRPFLLFVSSREVYGEPDQVPVSEDAKVRPLNVYARTKVAGEALVTEARATGLVAGVVRLSNVYGDVVDHVDRVIPAFVHAAVAGGILSVEGPNHTFDFTHIDDVVDGLLAAVDRLAMGDLFSPVHLVTGIGTTLGELADEVIALAGAGERVAAPPRSYDVQRFVGDPKRAEATFGFRARIPLRPGLQRLIAQVRAAKAVPPGP